MENKKNNQPLDLAVTDPEWTAITTAFAGQEVPAASPLTGKERWLCVLSALLGCQGMGAFRKALGSALDDGVEPVAVREVIYQATAYLGTGLNDQEREMITFCFLLAQGGCENQLRGHTRGNLGVGNDKTRLYAFVEQCMPYIGYPRTLNAMNIVDEVTAQ